MKTTLLKRLFFLFFIFALSSVYSQNTLKGVVVDSLTNEALVGATVALDGTSFGAACDIEGEFRINNIPDGKYKVRLSYIGYKTKFVEVDLVNKKVLEVKFQLNVEAIEGKTIEVSAQALGQAAAINQQISANTIVNVISEQKIKELPDANAAEALGRLPGVSVVRSGGEATKITLRGLSQNLTTITVDGIKLSPTDADSRGIDLSTISQGSLSGIVLSKAITSDMEAEAIAGNVNFVTKTAPEKRFIQFDAYGSYGSLDKSYDQYNFLGKYGERFFDNLLGVQLFGNFEKRNRNSEKYNLNYNFYNNRTKYQIQDFSITYIPETRKRGGIKLLLDFKTPDNGIIKFNTEYNKTEREFYSMNRNYPVTDGSIVYSFNGQEINTDIKNISLQGNNNLFNWQVNWNFSYSESNSETPYNYSMSLDEPSLTENGVVTAGMTFIPKELRTTTSYEKLIPYAIDNLKVATFSRAQARKLDNLDYEKTFFLDMKRGYNLFDFPGEVKFGVKYRSKYHRKNSSLSQALYYNGNGFFDYVMDSDGTVRPKDFAYYKFENYAKSTANLIMLSNFLAADSRQIYDKYSMGPVMVDQNRARAWYDMNINGYNPISKLREYTPDRTEDGGNYNLTESVTSGYLMNTLNVGTFATFITGIRIESDDNTYNARYSRYAVDEFTTFRDTTSHHSESIVLPNLHVILKPADFLNIRLAAFRGLERPNFNYRLPTYFYGIHSITYDNGHWAILGNTELKNADAWNYEANVQLFSNTIGLFSVSAFYKNIKNEVHELYYTTIKDKATTDNMGIVFLNDTPPFSGSYMLWHPFNSSKPTRVWGFEIEHQANFQYLPGLLRNIVLSYNFSITRTETYTPSTRTETYTVQTPGSPFPTEKTRVIYFEEKTRLTNSPDFYGNISLGYDIGGFSGRISYFYQDKFYNGFSSDGLSNTIQKKFGRLDLALKQEINNNISVGLNINNLTNEDEGTLMEDVVYFYRLETSSYRYGVSADLWLRLTL